MLIEYQAADSTYLWSVYIGSVPRMVVKNKSNENMDLVDFIAVIIPRVHSVASVFLKPFVF